MKNIKLETKKGFWAWLHRNRLTVVVMSFIILAPLTLVAVSYIGSYTSNRIAYFDVEETAETVYVKKFKDIDEIQGFEIFVEWAELKNAYQPVDSELWVGGYYTFDIWYEANPNYTINSIFITPLLQTDWADMRTVGNRVTITENQKNIAIEFNYHLPVKPLPFVSVGEPNLYLKVEYSVSYGGTAVNKVEYVKYSLKGLNPQLVIVD
ncbi:MAG TPA: hypothetical protein DEG42_07740 [Acholeplasmataceae bacterium]|nr:MAG: hypothetical protein A2Y43_03530 [Tenericutes bacterium GWA2_38_26]OHE30641.1 MAG: hypothetical protein A2084_04115 [Tenericutes bacterium GWC2_39_45]OHE32772.1 MAG: hypothetical protein A2009_02235 [Tenericutes bacterium GWD2_38_27]HBG32788.1 hypothetical protein [Acholeplasmataceae bacterium]HBY66240.1 hypothetical protein [Acholeplasmataceae bacterium]